MVIITGPNTGGKTVALKTLGLLALMNQAGLALPCAEGTVLPVFDGIYADIGDEQSLSQSLSTFSAHIANIAGIISQSTERSLVLLDELGSGTDPQEGSAIAMAILDHFIEKNSTVLITTHHGILKDYGYSRSGVENASVEFDPRTLSPTYRIIMGIPGESRAVDIASRNGLPGDLVEKARGYLDEERSDVSALIAGLKEKHRALNDAALSAKEEETRLREARRQADLKDLSLRQKEHILKTQGAGEFRRLLSESRKKLENLVREIREAEPQPGRETTLKVKEFLQDLADDSAAIDAVLEAEERALHIRDTSADFAPGAEVLAGSSRRRGRILRRDKQDKQGEISWLVEVGSVKMSFPQSELVLTEPLPEQKPLIAVTELAAPLDAKLELSLRGMRLEEALDALRHQMDAAVLAGLREFSIVHGKGEGILQKGVQDFLNTSPLVAEHYFSRPELGGTGRTEVVLRG
jgi:DNA mismatch repair protein MutS2